MLNDFCVYLHLRKNDDKILYVGKGKLARSKKITGRNIHWQRVVNKYGFYIKILKDNLAEQDAFDLEIKTIAEIGIKNLTNITLGGEGLSGHKHSLASKLKMSNSAKNMSDAHKKKLSISGKGREGILWSNNRKEAHSELMRNKYLNEAFTNPNKGKKLSKETKLKISESQYKKVNQIDLATGEILRAFDSVIDAEKAVNIKRHVGCVCNGLRKSAGGYSWSWIN